MVRNHGLTIDNLVAAEVVTADGRVLRVTESEHPDLFWAIRGGGGNFGVVTSFEFVAQRVTTVHAGVIAYAVDDVPTAQGLGAGPPLGPEELNSTLVLMPGLGDPMPPAGAMGLVLYAGSDKAAADAAFAPLLALGTVRCPRSSRSPTPTCSRRRTRRRLWHWRPTRSSALDDGVIAAPVVRRRHRLGWPSSGRSVGRSTGSTPKPPRSRTATSRRWSSALLRARGQHRRRAARAAAALRRAARSRRRVLLRLRRHRMPEDVARIYPAATLERLREVKRAYDPDNVFRTNFNITP